MLVISEIEKKVTDHNHDKYITTLEFSCKGLCCKISTSKLVTKTDFDAKLISLNIKN